MIHFVTGKPGGGKTLYSVHLIIRELLESERRVITNVPLDLEKLAVHLHQFSDEKGVDVHERVYLLDDDTETREFYLIRGFGIKGSRPSLEEYKRHGERMKFDWVPDDDPGVSYFIDEAHEFFDAREWANTGPFATRYLAQHRKLGDDVIFISQHLEQCDKRLRMLAQDFAQIRDHAVEKHFWFRGPPYFSRTMYLVPPNQPNAQVTEKVKFSLDPAIANCYKTTAGVGVHAKKGGPRRPIPKGIPLRAVLAAIPVIGLLFFGVVFGAKKGFANMWGGSGPEENGVAGGPAEIDSAENQPGQKGDRVPAGFYRTLAMLGSNVLIVLEDGTEITDEDPGLERIERNGNVWIDGERYRPIPTARLQVDARQWQSGYWSGEE